MIPERLSAPARAALQAVNAWLDRDVLQWGSLVQLAIIALALALFAVLQGGARRRLDAWAATRPNRVVAQVARVFAVALPWLLLAFVLQIALSLLRRQGEPTEVFRLAISLILAWTAIQIVSRLFADRRWTRWFAIAAWCLAALNILGLRAPAAELLDRIDFSIGTLRISVLLVIRAAIVLVASLWVANLLSRIAEARLHAFNGLSPSMQVLAAKLLRAALVVAAVLLAISALGIDLTGLEVFSGAVGVGLGFGLQKVVSNLISGVILLVDNSIKPGDVIELPGTYGWISRLNARYVSVVTTEGTEHLIPNEDLITQRVVNWTFSSDQVRLAAPVGVAYGTDLRRAMAVCCAAAAATPRVLADPPPLCLLSGFGDSAINLEIRFWIDDPRNGVGNVKSDVLLRVWDAFATEAIALPFPQRDLHIVGPVEIREAR